MPSSIKNLIEQHALPNQFELWVEQYFCPLAQDINKRQKNTSQAYVLGIQGTQGSGKSTAAEFLKYLLKDKYHLTCAVLSIDDFYLTLKERVELAHSVQPLLKTRGVPGTHDVPLAMSVIDKLKNQQSHQSTHIPRFNKAEDDRHPAEMWEKISGEVDVIIFEGWCVGLPPQSQQALLEPCNALEENEDQNLLWRTFVNDQLADGYQVLFSLIDDLLVLQAPSFKVVYQWRLLQEQKLINNLKAKGELNRSGHTMNQAQIKRFISHYQRLTEHALTCLPARASWVLYQNAQHEFNKMASSV